MAFTYKDYQESEAVRKAREERDAHSVYSESEAVRKAKEYLDSIEKNKVGEWTGGKYGAQVDAALDKILNRKPFTYDLNGDMLYQQYKDRYMTQGKQAMMDTMGQAAALTGGYGNSYAQTVGQQTYQGYLQGLNDRVPELYRLALDRYGQEGAELQNQYGLLKDQYNTEYGEYQDKISRWNADRDYAANAYNNERTFDYGKFTSDRSYYSDLYNGEYQKDYGAYSDAYSRAFAAYQQKVAEEQYAKDLALRQAQLAEQKRATNLSYSAKKSSGSSSSKDLKTPTSTMFEKAAKAYQEGGKSGLDSYIATLPDYDTDQIFGYIQDNGIQTGFEFRDYTLEKDTKNWFGGIDGNDLVEDEYGNVFKIKDLDVSDAKKKELTKLLMNK